MSAEQAVTLDSLPPQLQVLVDSTRRAQEEGIVGKGGVTTGLEGLDPVMRESVGDLEPETFKFVRRNAKPGSVDTKGVCGPPEATYMFVIRGEISAPNGIGGTTVTQDRYVAFFNPPLMLYTTPTYDWALAYVSKTLTKQGFTADRIAERAPGAARALLLDIKKKLIGPVNDGMFIRLRDEERRAKAAAADSLRSGVQGMPAAERAALATEIFAKLGLKVDDLLDRLPAQFPTETKPAAPDGPRNADGTPDTAQVSMREITDQARLRGIPVAEPAQTVAAPPPR